MRNARGFVACAHDDLPTPGCSINALYLHFSDGAEIPLHTEKSSYLE